MTRITFDDINQRPPTDDLRVIVNARVKAAFVPIEYRYVIAATSPVRADQPQVYGLMERYIDTFYDTEHRVKSLYLFSEATGTGKTTTASALANEYLLASVATSLAKGERPAMRPAYFLDVNALQTEYNSFTRPHVPPAMAQAYAASYYEKLDIAGTTPFVVFDDIGVRGATDGFRGDLHSVINKRVTAQLATVYTSNLPLTQMQQVFDTRLYDRMRDLCAEVPFTGESKRGRR